jgi:hypothetical protein
MVTWVLDVEKLLYTKEYRMLDECYRDMVIRRFAGSCWTIVIHNGRPDVVIEQWKPRVFKAGRSSTGAELLAKRQASTGLTLTRKFV